MAKGDLELADEHFRLLVESVKDYAVFLLDPKGIVRSWNAGAERIKGYTGSEIIGQHYSKFFSAADIAADKPAYQLVAALEHGRFEDVGWRHRKDGSKFWASTAITPLRDRDGKHVGFAKVTRDLTDTTYRAFVEATNAIVWSTDGSGRPVVDSPTWRAFTGQTEEEWRGLRGWDPVHPEDLPAMRVAWPRAKEERKIFEAEFRLRRYDGEYIAMAARAIPFLNFDGTVREWFGVTFDISARKRAEEERERAQLWLTTTLRSIGDGVIATDPIGNVMFMNPVAEQLTGWSVMEATGKPLAHVFRIINEDTRAPVENPVERVLREGATVGLANHTLLVRKDGSTAPIDDSAAPIRGADGRLAGVVLVFRDATIEKRELARRDFLARAGDELISSADHRDALSKIARLAVPRLADWCTVEIVEGNRTHRLATAHVDPAKIELAAYVNRRYPSDPNAATGVANVIRTGRSELYADIPSGMIDRAAKDDEHREILRELDVRSAMVVPLRGRERVFGAITFVYAESNRRYTADDLAFAEDLARRAAMIVERRMLEEEAEIANRTKDEFLATVSHELRTPLQAILGWATMLKRGNAKDQGKALDAILRNASAQARLVEDILDVSRVISGKLRLEIGRVKLGNVIHAAVDAVRPAATARQIAIRESVSPDLGEIQGDADRLQQVVWNLVSNSVKFTGVNGSVEVRAERAGSSIRIAVSDTGKGIAKEHLITIFERFRQVDSSATREHTGLGLGLAIVRYLVEGHGGTVEAASGGPGQGATFTVTLPARAIVQSSPTETTEPVRRELSLRGLRVLLVDDDRDAREMIGEAISHAGARVEVAGSAAEAFTLFTREPPHVLVSDIGMPMEDGYSFIRRIRALSPEKGGDVPAIALTAYARPEDVSKSEQAGFQLHVVKPADPDALVNAVRSLCAEADAI